MKIRVHRPQTCGSKTSQAEEKNKKRQLAVIRFMVPRRKWANARCMGMTPPRCPRARIGSPGLEGRDPLVPRFSKLLEESKAAPTSHIIRVVIVIRHDVESPVRTDPLAPSHGQGLTMKICNGRRWP